MVSVNDPQQPQGRRRWPWFAAAGVVLVAVVVTAFVLGRGGGTQPAQRPPAPVHWSKVGADMVPASRDFGPWHQEDGRASGFAHNERGAVFAALNLSARTTGAAGPDVYEPTFESQTYGDIRGSIDRISRQQSDAAPGSTTASGYWWRVSSGDPTGDEVVLTIAARSPQTSQQQGVAKFTRTLRWTNGDWQMRVPVSPPWLGQSTDGYTWLGGPKDAG